MMAVMMSVMSVVMGMMSVMMMMVSAMMVMSVMMLMMPVVKTDVMNHPTHSVMLIKWNYVDGRESTVIRRCHRRISWWSIGRNIRR